MNIGLNTIYMVCAIAGGAVLVLRFILMLVGLDHGDAADIPLDMDADVGIDVSDGGMNIFSLQAISGFFTMFGLVGLALLQIEAAPALTLLGGLVAGGITNLVTAWIFLKLQRLQSEGTMVITNAIGQVGTVYLTIPENASGVVTVAVQGAMRTLDAISEDGQRIPTGAIIHVVGVTAGKILVVKPRAGDQ